MEHGLLNLFPSFPTFYMTAKITTHSLTKNKTGTAGAPTSARRREIETEEIQVGPVVGSKACVP